MKIISQHNKSLPISNRTYKLTTSKGSETSRTKPRPVKSDISKQRDIPAHLRYAKIIDSRGDGAVFHLRLSYWRPACLFTTLLRPKKKKIRRGSDVPAVVRNSTARSNGP
ncbi:hypothetical protein WA026_008258 [Henosepilachna vigintioctopunctata]|uniref:Uncharacterized protein n=1 Tax=Henosepilachna vigintioctopunctata TaxID=420089 RepID=A0AAW1TIR7_9CUCU